MQYILVLLVFIFCRNSFAGDKNVKKSFDLVGNKLGMFDQTYIDNFQNFDNTDLKKIYKHKKKLNAERLLYSAALIPLYGQIRKWQLGIDDYKKTLIFGLVFSGLISFYIYNHVKYVDSARLFEGLHYRYYKRKMYTLSFIIIACCLSIFDSYLSVYDKMSDFSDSLDYNYSEGYF